MDNEAPRSYQDSRSSQAIQKLHGDIECPVLCEKCSKIPFHWSELSALSDLDKRSWSLGTWGDLTSRNCPFCQLVESCCWKPGASWERLSKPDDSSEVRLGWSQYCQSWTVRGLSPLGSHICFSENEDTHLVRAKGALEGWIDISLCKRWLSECEKQHCSECSPIPFNTELLRQNDAKSVVMRLVDVEAMCIVEAPQSCRYLALSYVWGNPKDGRLVLNLSNKHTLTKPHALRTHWHMIPTTISSAMKLVKDLGERYLWVDSLCLIQDDETELVECTRVMDKYYAMATLTIVAASGTDAHAGLPGIYPTRRKSPRLVKEILPRKWMTTMEHVDVFLRSSYYSSRGWT